MGGAPSFNPCSVTFFPFFPIIIVTVTTTLILIASAENHNSKENEAIPSLEDDNGATTSSPPPVSSNDSSNDGERNSVAFKPSTAVIVGVLTTTFFLVLLLLLYAKHCNVADIPVASNANPNGESNLHKRKNSGIERTVVESLPAFKFGSLTGQKNGLECAVCLNGFEDPEVLRLLPKCKHAFHMECVDMWLDQHSSCPLCRYKVNPDDIVLPQRQNTEEESSSSNIERGNNINDNVPQHENENVGSQQVSSMEERDSGLLQINALENNEASSFRRSFDSNNSRNTRSEGVIGEHRLDHQIILSPHSGVHQRCINNSKSCDMLYLTFDRIISESSSSQLNNPRGRRTMVERNHDVLDDEMENGFGGGGRGERNLRTVSDMAGMSKFLSREIGRERERGDGREEQERQREGVASRWLAWISGSKSKGATSE
jgi:E3 ubiquitin-protein ligase RNF38/44